MSFKDSPIRRKLMTIILLTSGAVLLLTGASFFAYEFLTFRQASLRQLSTQGEIIAANSTAALAFQNVEDAREILTACKAEPHIVEASLYDSEGKLFSRYPANLPPDAFPATPEKDGYRLEHSYLTGFQPVVQAGNRLGTLYLKSDMGAMYERFRLYGVIVVLVIAGAFLLAYFLSGLLQELISQPILALADTARAVSVRRDYTVRATKRGEDELGLLTDAFNQMLTQIQQQDGALRESEGQIRAVLNSTISAVMVMDAKGIITDCNNQAEKMFGWRRSEVLGREMAELVLQPDCRQPFQRSMERYFKTGESPELNRLFETGALRHDGSKFPVQLAVSPMKTGDVVTFCGFITDITEQKRADALREEKEDADRANRAKSEFLSRMSHELRTPLNAILGFSQLLDRQNPTATQRSRLSHIIRAGEHLLKLIDEVLDISRIESGNLQLSPEPVCVVVALQEALDLIRPLAEERAIDLSTPSPIDDTYFVLADSQRFKQVLLNVLSNAVKYTPIEGKVTISCRSASEDTLRILVSDTGVGIPADKLAGLFTPFERLGAEQSSVEGTGLGLALSQRLMHAMGGSIGAESTFGKGSTFWVELPRAKSPLGPTLPRELNVSAGGPGLRDEKLTILYIEDNLSNLALIEEILSEQPQAELLSAMQGKLGLDLARKHLPDLILLDLHLPDLSGSEVLAQLRREEATRNIPVIVISADATEHQANELIAAGAHAYLTKPLDVSEFLETVEKVAFKNARRTNDAPA